MTWLPVSGRVSASTVGAKNMASSSGCAISRQMRLLRNAGKRVCTTLAVYMYRMGTMASTHRAVVMSMLRVSVCLYALLAMCCIYISVSDDRPSMHLSSASPLVAL